MRHTHPQGVTWSSRARPRTWSETYQRKDSQIFVTDEVAGFLLTVLLFHLPDQPVLTTLWAFPITRILDIVKVPPAKQLEKLPAGWVCWRTTCSGPSMPRACCG